MSRKEGASPNHSSADTQNLTSLSTTLSVSTNNLSVTSCQGGRRPVIIPDAQHRAMLHKIRDSLAHLQKNSLPSPGSDTSGASGTSTPSKDGVQNKEALMTKRNDNYNSAALAEIRKSLQTYKKDEPKEADIETPKVNVKELIQQICPDERNGLTTKFGGLVSTNPSIKVNQSTTTSKTEIITTSIATAENDTISPPPLPPRTRALTTPPPPLPPRDTQANTVSGLSRTSVQYQPMKRSTKDANSAGTTPRGVSPSPNVNRLNPNAMETPSATPPSSLEQLAEQTGFTTQQIQEILMQHKQKQMETHNYNPSPVYQEPYSNAQTIESRHQTMQQHQQQYHLSVHQTSIASPNSNGDIKPPPQYSSNHIISQAPPPPPPYYTQHQPSPASSVTSGSSNDYLLMNYGHVPITGEYRTPAYGESPSSGSSSPASVHGHPSHNHLHPGNMVYPHTMGGQHLKPTPIPAWEAKQQPLITQSVRSQMVSRPLLQTATAPPNHTQAPPSYTSSVHASVSRHGAAMVGGGGGGNVHIKLRNHQDPQFQVTGYPSFQVTAQNSHLVNKGRIPEHMTPSIQLQFSTGNPIDAHIRRKGSLETRSDSPVSRTTNQSPCSMISTTSTNSDLIPERPPPPYPGNSKQYPGNGTHPTNISAMAGAVSSEPSEPEQSETESESDRRSTKHRCTSPIPKLRPEGEKKDDDRRWTKLRHYSPAAFKFYMEQHIENVLKQHQERIKRRVQLEKEMSRTHLSEEAQNQMRLMLKQKETNYLRLKRAKMDRSMFEVITKLGIGAFGEVSLVRKCQSEAEKHQGDQLYAMKTLRKVDVIRRNQVAHVKAERDILAEAELEWVTKLYYSFQDKENLYFIMEYIPGGDLMALLIKKGIFDEPLAMFYVAEMVLAIESVHKMGFIHRDIKPDNILIDKDGHIKLTDFGLCTGFRWTHNSKYYQEGNHNRQDSMDPQDLNSDPCQCPKELPKILEKRRRKEKQRCLAHSLVGTPNYIAPEVLTRQGYTKSCDWWSVGVILYEMLVGQPPFLANSPKETQIKVVHWKSNLHIPDEAGLTQPAHDLILKLCCGAENRLGKNGADEIKSHRFFDSINFGELRNQRAPYKPVIRYPTDTSNFDEVEEQQPSPYKIDDLRQNGHYPEHAFSEFTFRRFFDDGGHARPLNMTESLSHNLRSLSLSNNNINNCSHSTQSGSQSEERTPQNSYHEEESRPSGGKPVYV